MSRATRVIHEACELAKLPTNNRKRGGARKQQNGQVWSMALRALNRLGLMPDRIKEVDLDRVMFCLQRGIACAHTVEYMHNVASSLRTVLAKAGVDTRGMSSRELGLGKRNRNGKRRPLTADELTSVCARAAQKDTGHALKLALQWRLGLRQRESVQSAPDLRRWSDAVAAGARLVPITLGTKSGRPRLAAVLDSARAETIELLREAADYCDANGGVLLMGRGRNLESTIGRARTLDRQAGLWGEITSHSLRLTYAVTLAEELLDAGEEEFVVLVRVAAALGHGPTRLRFTLVTYLQSITRRFARIFVNNRLMGAKAFLARVTFDKTTGESFIAPAAAARSAAGAHPDPFGGQPSGSTRPEKKPSHPGKKPTRTGRQSSTRAGSSEHGKPSRPLKKKAASPFA